MGRVTNVTETTDVSTEQQPRVDVVGVGNAIVDVISHSDEAFLAGEGLVKNSMSLIDADRAHDLYSRMGPGIEASGGSCANTMAGIASFGGTAAYIGKIADDQLGEVFAHDMRAVGVDFDVPPASGSPSTQSIRKAMDVTHAAGGRAALALSDTFCVERHHDEFRELVAGPVDVLFANRAELFALYDTDDLDLAIDKVRSEVGLACVTLGTKGSVLVTADEIVEVEAAEIAPVVDTTGAGDQYAAGVLFGLARGLGLADAGWLGSLAAAEVISHVGPRPMMPLSDLFDDEMRRRVTSSDEERQR